MFRTTNWANATSSFMKRYHDITRSRVGQGEGLLEPREPSCALGTGSQRRALCCDGHWRETSWRVGFCGCVLGLDASAIEWIGSVVATSQIVRVRAGCCSLLPLAWR